MSLSWSTVTATAVVVVAIACAAPTSASALCVEGCHPPVPPPVSPPPPPPSLSVAGLEGPWSISAQYDGTNSVWSANLLGNPEMLNSDGDPLVPAATFTASGKAGSQVTVNAVDQTACQIPPGVAGDDGGYTSLIQGSHSASGSGDVSVMFQPRLVCPFGWLDVSSTQTAWATEGNYTTPYVSFQYTFSY
jgi:hypothetical protein